jgi:Diacylglycerol kinase catalytic domain
MRHFVSSFVISPKYHTTWHLSLSSVSFNNSIVDGTFKAAVDDRTASPLIEWEDSHLPSPRIAEDTSAIVKAEASLETSELPKTVVMMNTNARGVSNRSVSDAQEIFGADSVFSTSTPDDMYAVLQKAFGASSNNIKHDVLVVMGGDGTLSLILQTLCEILQASSPSLSLEGAVSNLPLIAYVPMGTGNAVGSVVGCHYSPKMPSMKRRKQSRFGWLRSMWRLRRSERFRATLLQLRDALLHPSQPASGTAVSKGSIVELPILEITSTSTTTRQTSSSLCFFAGGTLCYFAIPFTKNCSFVLKSLTQLPECIIILHTVGFDSLMLNDFKRIKEWSQRTGVLRRFLSSVAGYCVALVCKTLPQTILRSSHKVRVQVTTSKEAWWVDHRRGDYVERTREPLLYQGETGIIAGSTVPYYGGRLRLFPFARMTLDQMHLRLGRIHPWTGFVNIPSIFSGSYRDTSNEFGVLDFIGSDFTVHVSNPSSDKAGFPLQHSGESGGPVSSFRLRVLKTPIRFWSLLPDR